MNDAATPNRIRRRESTLWQRRFREHQIRDDDDYRRHLDYLHTNPVHRGYCERPDAWPHSSLHRLIHAGLYPPGWKAGDGVPGESRLSRGYSMCA